MQLKEEVEDEEGVDYIAVEVELDELRVIAPSLRQPEVVESKTYTQGDNLNNEWDVEYSDLSVAGKEGEVNYEYE